MANYGGYGYEQGFPGGDLDATQELTGPGSTAYEAQGPYSSYASESDRGGIYEHNVTDLLDASHRPYYASSTAYTYHGGDYSYSSYSSSRLSAYAGYAYGTGYADTSSYHNSSSTAIEQDGLTTVQQYSTSYYAFADGTYTQDFTTRSFQEEGFAYVQGSGMETHSSVSGYIGGSSGYGGYYGYGT